MKTISMKRASVSRSEDKDGNEVIRLSVSVEGFESRDAAFKMQDDVESLCLEASGQQQLVKKAEKLG